MFGFERCADCAENERDLAAARARLASLESELARIRPVFEAACAQVDSEGPLLPWDRRRDPVCVAVDTSRGYTSEQAIEARLRELP